MEEKDNVILSLEEDISILRKDLQECTQNAEGATAAHQQQIDQVKAAHEKDIDDIKQKDAESRTTLMKASNVDKANQTFSKARHNLLTSLRLLGLLTL